MNFAIAVAAICFAGVVAGVAGQNDTTSAVPESTAAPTKLPTAAPTKPPTAAPTQPPTAAPTQPPTADPTQPPTAAPTKLPTAAPTQPPTVAPTDPPMIGPFTYDLMGKDDKVCAKLKLKARIKSGEEITDLPKNVTVGGNCDSDISLTFAKTILKISFDKKEKTEWELKNFAVTLNDGAETTFSDNATAKYHAAIESAFSCQTKHEITEGKMTLVIEKLKFQPFTNGANTFGRADSCDADKAGNNIVPIAVGAALAVLVIIVLVLYLIGRRKHQKGYQTV